MDLDGFLKLDDQQIKEATAQADIAGKWIQNEILWQQAVKAAEQNLALFLNIRWDADAHGHLVRTRNIALQRVRVLRERSARLESAVRGANRLLAGEGSWDAIRDGWLGFEYLRGVLPFSASAKAAAMVPDPASYEQGSWLHPMHDVPNPPTHRDPGSLLKWARINTLYPVMGGAAWNYMATFLTALNEGATNLATEIQARTADAEKAALAIEQQDWDRLKHPAGLGGGA
jgi:hypothetical protein